MQDRSSRERESSICSMHGSRSRSDQGSSLPDRADGRTPRSVAVSRLGSTAARSIVSGYVSRERLRQLYREATIVVYPSHFEGFGLPVLEAMACGAPVITTNGGAIPEAAGDAAMLVPPSSPDDLARAIRSLLSSSEQRAELSLRGIERSKKFSWSRAAARVSEIFRHAAEARR